MVLGSETGIEEHENYCSDDRDYIFIGKVIFGLVFALIGILSIIYFLVWGDLNETLNKIAPVVQSASTK